MYSNPPRQSYFLASNFSLLASLSTHHDFIPPSLASCFTHLAMHSPFFIRLHQIRTERSYRRHQQRILNKSHTYPAATPPPPQFRPKLRELPRLLKKLPRRRIRTIPPEQKPHQSHKPSPLSRSYVPVMSQWEAQLRVPNRKHAAPRSITIFTTYRTPPGNPQIPLKPWELRLQALTKEIRIRTEKRLARSESTPSNTTLPTQPSNHQPLALPEPLQLPRERNHISSALSPRVSTLQLRVLSKYLSTTAPSSPTTGPTPSTAFTASIPRCQTLISPRQFSQRDSEVVKQLRGARFQLYTLRDHCHRTDTGLSEAGDDCTATVIPELRYNKCRTREIWRTRGSEGSMGGEDE